VSGCTDIFDEVRQSILRKLADNAQAMTAALLAYEATQRRQDELVAQLRQLPPQGEPDEPARTA
jgi:hypothetical protein